MTKPGRISCAVLGCRRTASAEKYGADTRICCRKCWRLGSAKARNSYHSANRSLRKCSGTGDAARSLVSIVEAAFEDVVREATEARAGLG